MTAQSSQRNDQPKGRVINRSDALQRRREEFAANARPATSTIFDWTTSLSASPVQLKAFDGAITELHDQVSVGNHEVWGDPLPSHLQYRKRDEDTDAKSADAHAIAARGVAGAGGAMPHADVIQKSFGRHDISHVQAHTSGQAAAASQALGAEAYATGTHVAFGASPSLHTAAHEAAHIVQQQAGVSLKDGIGESGDRYERHADEVADAVVQGKSAEGILDRMAGGGGAGSSVQMKALQFEDEKDKKGGKDGKDGKDKKDKKEGGGKKDGKGKSQLSEVKLLAQKGMDKLSEEELKSIKFGKKGKTRFDPNTKLPYDADGLTYAEWDAACSQLDNMEAAKGASEGTEHNLHQPRVKGVEIKKVYGEDTSVPQPNSPPETEQLPPGQKPKPGIPVETSGQVLNAGEAVSAAAISTEFSKDGHEGKLEVASAAANTNANLTISPDGVKGTLGAGAEANLVKVAWKIAWEYPTDILGEKVVFKAFVAVAGMIGVEGNAQLEAEVGKMKGAAPDGGKLKGMIGGNAGAFAGAQVAVTVGGEVEWQKKAPDAYTAQLEATVRLIAGRLGGPVGYLVAALGGDQLGAKVLSKLFEWGPAGNDVLASISGTLEGSAGVGAEAKFQVGFDGTKIVMDAKAGLSLGIGAGFAAKIGFDPVAAMKFGLVVAGELVERIEGMVKERLLACATDLGELFAAAWDKLCADNKAIEMVREGIHEALGPNERALMLVRILDFHTDKDSHDMACKIVLFSVEKGDVDSVLSGEALERWEAKVPERVRQAVGYHVSRSRGILHYTTVVDPAGCVVSATPANGFVRVTFLNEAMASTYSALNENVYKADEPGAERLFKTGGTVKATKILADSSRIAAGFETKEEAERASVNDHGTWEEPA
jgi:hypothetical protein